jgi:hypothetical protein
LFYTVFMDASDRLESIPKTDHAGHISEDLAVYGLVEVDTGIIEDTYENRKIMRRSGMRWLPLFDDNGEPTELCQVLTKDMLQASSYASLEDKRVLMVDPGNLNSDYKTGINLLLEPEAKDLIPFWVISASKYWNMVELRREDSGDPSLHPNILAPPARCSQIKSDGVRCQFWTPGAAGQLFCKTHLPMAVKARVNYMAKARSRLAHATVAAVDMLEVLMDEATSEPVRLGAAKEILDRAGIRGGVEIESKVDITVRPAAEVISARLDEFKVRAAQRAAILSALEVPVDVEVVSDDDVS